MRKNTIFSPNYSKKSRKNKDIQFVIIHYTGMQSEIESFKKLIDVKSKVSCHYFIRRNGKITQMVKDQNVAWHAGKSKWKNLKNLNENSIGIELVNKGHKFGYQNFPKMQINSLINLCKVLKKNYRIKKENFLGHSDIAPLRKLDPGEKFPWEKLSHLKLGTWYKKNKINFKLKKKKSIEILFFKNLYKIGYRYFSINKRSKNDRQVIKSFQQKFLPKKISGKVDKKTLEISHFLTL
jgi:N-acetylmuramoyl-L-alanine amidase